MNESTQRLTLDEATQSRIRAEELFRREIRSELKESSRQSQSRLLAFLNSTLGIWLLSSVLLGLYGWGFTKLQTHLTNKSQREARRDDIETELAFRAFIWARTLEPERIGASSAESAEQFARAYKRLLFDPPLKGDGSSPSTPFLPQYQDRSYISLRYELSKLEEKLEEKKSESEFMNKLIYWEPRKEFSTVRDALTRLENETGLALRVASTSPQPTAPSGRWGRR